MFKNLKLAPKFTLLLSLVFLGAIIISGIALSQVTQKRAAADVAYRGQLLMETMNSLRNYTNHNINPLLTPQLETVSDFIPETVPAYSARAVFDNLRQHPDYQEYFYKEAVLNPTNPRDKADNFEALLIRRFRQESNLPELSGFRTIRGENVFYQALPIIIKDQSCLRCHSTPDVAPKSMLNTYGSDNGFGWKLNEIVGIQALYVPAQEVFSIARQLSAVAIAIFIATFALVILLINRLLKRMVIQPIRPMARLAHKISNDDIMADKTVESDIENLGKIARNSDELGQLARIFQQMAHAIYIRNQSFAHQLEELSTKSEAINVRSSGKSSQIAYFKALQKKAETIRKRLAESDKPLG